MKEYIHVATTTDENYIQHLSVMLCSLFENNPQHHFVIYVLKDFNNNKLNVLKSFVEKHDHKIIFIDVNIDDFEGLKVDGHISKATYYRLKLPEYLKTFTKKVLYLDCDIIVLQDIMELWQTNLNGFIVGAVEYDKENKYFIGGVMLIDISRWLLQDITPLTLKYARNHYDEIQFWDQDALNKVLKDKWLKINQKWNMISNQFDHLSKNLIANLDIGILHFTGSLKPWNYHCEHPMKSEYFKYLKKTFRRKFYFKEETFFHHFKQGLKSTINKITGRKIFKIYV